MSLENRVDYLERTVSSLLNHYPNNYDVEMLASNDHIELEHMINGWLRKIKPKRIIEVKFVADGAEYSYCVLFLYEPRSKPLPKDRKRS